MPYRVVYRLSIVDCRRIDVLSLRKAARVSRRSVIDTENAVKSVSEKLRVSLKSRPR